MVARLGDQGMLKQFFLDFVKSHPAVLDPIVRYQKAIKTKLFGLKYWKQACIIREQMSGGKGFESVSVIAERIVPTRKARRRRRCMSDGKSHRKSHTEGESDSSDSDDGNSGGSAPFSMQTLLKVRSNSSVGEGGGRRSRLSRGSRDSFSSDGGSEKHSKRGSFDKHSVGSLCDEEPAVPRVDKTTGKMRRSFGSDGGSLVDDNEWDAFDQRITQFVVTKKSSDRLAVEGSIFGFAVTLLMSGML